MTFTWKQILGRLVSGGTSTNDSPGRIRHIRISNFILLTTIANTLSISLLFALMDEVGLFQRGLIIVTFFILIHLVNIKGYPNLGRPMSLIFSNFNIFYFANLFRGQADVELFFFMAGIAPFVYFCWEEKVGYLLCLLPLTLFLLGEASSWEYFSPYQLKTELNFKYVRMFCILATFQQIISGCYYFLHLNVRYESQISESMKQIEIENKKKIQSQKMSSLGEMAGGVSHEINNPLMVILGQSYKIRHKIKPSQGMEDLLFPLDKIDEMVHRIARIIKALKNFSRNSEFDPLVGMRLSEVLTLGLDLCRERFRVGSIDLQINLSSDPVILCRPTEISQVLLNLLNNAYDAVQNVEAPVVRISSATRMQSLELLIQDNGMGIPREIRDKIMQPFFTTKDVDKGTGLGLSISKGLIESHQGKLTLLEDQELTTFQIILPIQNELVMPQTSFADQEQ